MTEHSACMCLSWLMVYAHEINATFVYAARVCESLDIAMMREKQEEKKNSEK